MWDDNHQIKQIRGPASRVQKMTAAVLLLLAHLASLLNWHEFTPIDFLVSVPWS